MTDIHEVKEELLSLRLLLEQLGAERAGPASFKTRLRVGELITRARDGAFQRDLSSRSTQDA